MSRPPASVVVSLLAGIFLLVPGLLLALAALSVGTEGASSMISGAMFTVAAPLVGLGVVLIAVARNAHLAARRGGPAQTPVAAELPSSGADDLPRARKLSFRWATAAGAALLLSVLLGYVAQPPTSSKVEVAIIPISSVLVIFACGAAARAWVEARWPAHAYSRRFRISRTALVGAAVYFGLSALGVLSFFFRRF